LTVARQRMWEVEARRQEQAQKEEEETAALKPKLGAEQNLEPGPKLGAAGQKRTQSQATQSVQVHWLAAED